MIQNKFKSLVFLVVVIVKYLLFTLTL